MKLSRYVLPYKKQFFLGSAAKLLEAFLELYLPLVMAKLLDDGITNGNRSIIFSLGLQMIVLALAGFGAASLCQYFAAVTSLGTGTQIRQALMEHISHFSYQELDQLGSSTLINRMMTDVNNYQEAVAKTMRLLTRAPFIGIGAVVMSLTIDRSLSLVFICLIPIVSVVVFFFMKYASPIYQKSQEKLDEFALVVRENLTGVRVIRAFGTTQQESQRAAKATNQVRDINIKAGSFSAWMQPISSVLVNLGILLILYFGAQKVNSGLVSQGDLLALTVYATKILYSIGVTANLVVIYTKAVASNKRLLQVFAIQPRMDFPSSLPPAPRPGVPLLVFHDLSFHYPGGTPVLENISFNLNQGETLGIVGTTGSGKTTLVNLIQRFYDPISGEIQLLGEPLTDYPLPSLRRIVAAAPQQNVLFSGSIKDNLKMANPEATNDQLIQALKTAQAWDFVSALPEGMDAPVFEGGKNFSGGQKQRLTVARALVKQPNLLILDDNLSALDYRTDLTLRQALKQHQNGMTMVIVSQRISSVLSADQILVLDQGKMAGLGSHLELLEDCPTYRELYLSQNSQEGYFE